MMTFQEIILKLQNYWNEQGCIIEQPYDMEKGAGTYHPATFLKVLGPEPWKAAYVEPCRRPSDGRYGENPNRFQYFYQYQVVIKPSPKDIQNIYLKSLHNLGINLNKHDIRFVEDDWESPTLGAWGIGWEVWLDGMEITQFTYFQQAGGMDLNPVSIEITYGLERLAMIIQKKETVFDVEWVKGITYKDVRYQAEKEFSEYNFEVVESEFLFNLFNIYEKESLRLIQKRLVLPAYDYVLKSSHMFNMLDARKAISVTERMAYILRVKKLARQCAELYLGQRENLGYPLLKNPKVKSLK